MIDLGNLSVAIIVSGVIGWLLYSNFRLTMKAGKLNQELQQSALDNLVYLRQIGELIEQQQKLEVSQTDGFLTFVSNSRDWAFTYIEDVQESIQSLKTAVENGYPTEEEMKKLFDLLPENNKENNNE